MQSRAHPLRVLTRRVAVRALAASLAITGLAAQAQLRSGDNPEASATWQKVRASLYGNRPIANATTADGLTLEAPARAIDAAVVPVAIRTHAAASNPVRQLTLIIDNNPSPIAAIFDFSADSGRADIETRVRVDEYSHVRAVAELADGRLLMATRFVKASGGCSAPPDKDPAIARATLGRMLLRVEDTPHRDRPVLAQLAISHPNDSGMAMDQLTRQYTPAHYLRQLTVTYAGRPVMTADLDFAISENPNFRFWFVPRGSGELKAEISDTRQLQFTSTLSLVVQQ